MTIDALLKIIGGAIAKTAIIGVSLAVIKITVNVVGRVLKNSIPVKEN